MRCSLYFWGAPVLPGFGRRGSIVRFLWAILLVMLALPSAAQKHPFTFEDMMALKRLEEPEVSPDGKWVLFAAVDVDLKANTKTPLVWVVPLNSDSHVSQKQGDMGHPTSSVRMTESREREIISDQDADRPRWSPDGKRFAFVSTKENGSQIWIAEFDKATGTVTGKHRLTDISTEADGELWSPDGKNILYKSDVYPECDGPSVEETVCNAKKVDEAKNSKVKAQVFTHLLYRHWNAYKEGKRTHLFVISAGNAPPPAGAVNLNYIEALPRDLSPGDYDAPVFSLGGQDDYAFSPDGQEICYASNHDPEPAISTNNDLFTVPVNAGATSKDVLAATKNITAENKAADNTPLYSPDGKHIAYRAQQRPGYESDRWRLMLYDRKIGGKKTLAEEFDNWVGTFTWWGSSAIFFGSEEQGNSRVYYVLLNYAPPYAARSSLQGYDDDLTVTPDNKFILFTKMSSSAPAEIYKSPIILARTPHCGETGGDVCSSQDPNFQLTHLNDTVLSRVSMSPLETFWFTGAHNDKVQGWVIKPPNFDPNKKYPVKFIVHGGPEVPFGDEWSYRWNFELFAANGYVVVFINFHGSPGYGQKFIDAINGDWGGAPFEDLMKGLDYAEQHYPFIDKDRECALGASYGGYMTNWILGHTNRFKCIVTHDGMFNPFSAWGTTEELWFNEWEFKGMPYTNHDLYNKWSPRNSSPNFKTPTLVIHSQLDYRLDVSEGFQLFTTLQRMGVPSKMLYFPDEGHWVLKPQNSQLWYKTVNDWVDQWVGK
jgi:dipeptidyl aminopeptidase/acylaminoacyl peptidase